MTEQEVKNIIIEIIGEIVPDEDLSNLDDNKELKEQLELDSMDFLDIVMELRKRYNIEIPESDYGKLASLDSCCNYLKDKI